MFQQNTVFNQLLKLLLPFVLQFYEIYSDVIYSVSSDNYFNILTLL